MKVTDLTTRQTIYQAINRQQEGINKLMLKTTSDFTEAHYYNFENFDTARQGMLLLNAINTTEQSLNIAQQRGINLSLYANAIEQISVLYADARKLGASVINIQGNIKIPIANEAKSLLQSLQSILANPIFDQKMWSGSFTEENPIDLTTAYQPLIDGIASLQYYQGDNFSLASYNDGYAIDYGIKASERGFANLIASLNLLIASDLESSETIDKNLITEALTLLNDTADFPGELIARIGVSIRTNQQEIDFLTDSKLTLGESAEKCIILSDMQRAELGLKFNEYSMRLEATFAMAKKILQELSFINYI
jgi:hypothetical protein